MLLSLSSTQGCLESSLVEKENALAKTSEELQLADGLREALGERELRCRDASEKLLQAEHAVRAPPPGPRWLVRIIILQSSRLLSSPAARGRFQALRQLGEAPL